MKQPVLLGQVDYTVLAKIRDTDGAPATGLTEANIDIAYARVETDNDVTTTDVTPAALAALTDAHTDWGFEEVSATDHPGLYRLDIADAVFAAGAWSAVVTITGTGLDPCDLEFVLVVFDPKATALPANSITAAAIANGAIDAATFAADVDAEVLGYLVDDATRIDASALNTATGTTIPAIKAKTDSLTFTVANVLDANALRLGGTVQTGRDIGASVLLSSGIGTGQLSITSGVVSANATQFAGQTITCSGGVTVPAATLASTTNITAGTITTATNLTNAPTSGDLTATMKASVNAEVDSAIETYRLDELLAADSDIDGAAPPTVGSVFHELLSKTAGSFTFDQTTDSLEALRDRGDAAWITATGFSTHSAADVWEAGTRTLTAGTNIVLVKGTGVTGFTDLSAAQVNAEVDTALSDVGLTTTVTGRVDAAVSTRATPAQILTTALTEAYNADGAAPTLSQAVFVIMQRLTEFAISGTTITAKKLDGSTTAFTLTLDSSSTPTSSTRAT